MSSFIDREEADRFVSPFYERLRAVVAKAWSDWRDNVVSAQMQHPRVRANFVWNQMLANAKRELEGIEGVRVVTLKQWEGVLVGDRVFIRMKKGDRKLFSRNYPTQTALAFHNPTRDLFEGIARLELLYVLDDDGIEVERVALVQRHKQHVAWSIDLLEQHHDSQNVIPMEPIVPSGSAADRMLRPKDDKGETRRVDDGKTG